MWDSIPWKAWTFALNRKEAIHSRYSYIEWYSSCLVVDELEKIQNNWIEISSLYDPFWWTGTTPLVWVQHWIQSYYSESNPFMLWVINTKINSVKNLIDSWNWTKLLESFYSEINWKNFKFNWRNIEYWWFEKFYDTKVLYFLLEIKKEISKVENNDVRAILMLALSSILVPVSKMVRRWDLRYATEKELEKKSKLDVKDEFLKKLSLIITDINNDGKSVTKKAIELSDDARLINEENLVDCIITSPPYLNGTNYIRNTKLELKMNDFVNNESELPLFHSKWIVAWINNVSKRKKSDEPLDFIIPFIDRLSPVVYDERITKMIIWYFNDMNQVIRKLSKLLKDNWTFIMDIWDSQFAWVHIPTHDLLEKICNNNWFIKYDESILRERRSKNNMILSQRVLRFKIKK